MVSIEELEFVVEERLKSIIHEHLIVKEVLKLETVVDQLSLDSLDIVAIKLTLEDEFQVNVCTKDYYNCKTINDIYKLLLTYQLTINLVKM